MNLPLPYAKAYRKLYEEGVWIVENLFDPPDQESAPDSMYPPPLFACTREQANYVTKIGISRDAIFDGVVRSTYHGGYATHIIPVKSNKKKITGPGPRVQLKLCKGEWGGDGQVRIPAANHLGEYFR